MAVNKVIYYGEVLVDMSQVTVKPETLSKGETALDASGELIVGTNEAKEPVLQRKTVAPTTSAQEVIPDEGYDGLSEVNIAAVPTAERAKPTISIDNSGLITATTMQTEGYVESGKETATRKLTAIPAATITPTTQRVYAARPGGYTTGNIIVSGDANLKAENIKSGVSIFGVKGSYEGSGDGGSGTTGGTCSVTFNTNEQAVFDIVCNNGSGWVHEPTTGEPINKTFTVAKGTFVCLAMDMGAQGNVESEITGSVEYAETLDGYVAIYIVNGDGSVSITPHYEGGELG